MKPKVPKYFFFRIYFLALLLYFLLVFPVGGILSLKHGPEWMRGQGGGILTDTTITQDTSARFGLLNVERTMDTAQSRRLIIGPESNNNSNSMFGTAITTINRFLLLAILLGLIYNLPFKRYFNKRRKGKRINPSLRNYCKKQLLRTPIVNAGILSACYLAIHSVMLYYLLSIGSSAEENLEKKLFEQFFYISLVAAVLIILFMYFWQKHRVHMRYIEHLYTPEELRQRVTSKQFFRIRNRMLITSGMTTLLPLGIVIFYLILSLTTFKELGIETITEEQGKILFGKYLSVFSNIPSSEFSANYFYVNAIDSLLMFIGIFTGIMISFIYIIFFVRWNTEDIVSPVKQLLQCMERTGEGELEQYSLVRTSDEVGQLSEGYNRMTERLKAYFDNIKGLTDTYSRFVPNQFLDILGKESYTDIKLGDQVEKEMTVLFSDIRSFTSLSEAMTPKQNFDFINAYLGVMEPVIRKNNGFIDKYIGDAIMALFPSSPDDAVNAAIAMRHALQLFNTEKKISGIPDIECGIGIHTGRLMLGIVGAEGRMDGTVISDAVNLSARLEGLTKQYQAAAIISKDSIQKLKTPGNWSFRYLDRALVKGKQDQVIVYEIIEAEPEERARLKLEGLPMYEQALRALDDGEIGFAQEHIQAFLRFMPDDPAALKLLEICKSGGHPS